MDSMDFGSRKFYRNADLYKMEIIGDNLGSAAVPYDAPETLKKNVLAALRAYGLGINSIDYVKRKYGDSWIFPSPETAKESFYSLLTTIRFEAESISSIFANGVIRPKHVGLLAAEGALLRLWGSFHSVILLISQKYAFESFSILRMIFEQIAWSFYVYEMLGEEKIVNTKSHKTIAKLKELIPNSGRLYGLLSTQAHLDPIIHNQYLKYDDKRYFVIYSSPELINIALYLLLYLVDTYRIISERISYEFVDKLKAWDKQESGRLILLTNRPLSDKIEQFELKLFPA